MRGYARLPARTICAAERMKYIYILVFILSTRRWRDRDEGFLGDYLGNLPRVVLDSRSAPVGVDQLTNFGYSEDEHPQVGLHQILLYKN